MNIIWININANEKVSNVNSSNRRKKKKTGSFHSIWQYSFWFVDGWISLVYSRLSTGLVVFVMRILIIIFHCWWNFLLKLYSIVSLALNTLSTMWSSTTAYVIVYTQRMKEKTWLLASDSKQLLFATVQSFNRRCVYKFRWELLSFHQLYWH